MQVTAAGNASIDTISNISALNHPTTLVYDAAGNLYLSDYINGRILKVTPAGIGTVFATGPFAFGSSNVTALAVDPDGTVYIGDRANNYLVQVTPSGKASTLSPPGVGGVKNPQGVSSDGMGNIYILDAGNQRILRRTKSGAVSTLQFSGPGLSTGAFNLLPTPTGDLYIPDWTNNQVLFLNNSQPTLSFATTMQFQTSSDSPKTATITNLGNLPLAFSSNPTFTTDFTENTADTNPCTSTTTLSATASCNISVKFTPQVAGNLSAAITVSDDNFNTPNSTQSIAASGVATSAGDTTATTVTISPSPLTNGQTATLTASVTDTATGQSATIPTGAITFTDQVGTTITTLNSNTAVTLVNGVATLSNVQLSGIGTHTITASYAGAPGNFRASGSTATVVLDKAPVTITDASPNPLTIIHGQAGIAAVTISSTYSTLALPSGSLTYSILNSANVSVNSGTVSLSAGTGNATASIAIPNTLPTGNYTLALNYGGDANYAASTTATALPFTVEQLTPVVAFAQPAPIPYGTNLSSILSATATNGTTPVPGNFVYTTGSGALQPTTVLTAGTYPITATFSPTDGVTYTTATANITLVVDKVSANVAPAINTVTLTTGQSGTVLITVTAPAQNLAAPTGVLTYTLAKTVAAAFQEPSLWFRAPEHPQERLAFRVLSRLEHTL